MYNELSPKNRFQSVPIAGLYLYSMQRENLVFKNSLCISECGFAKANVSLRTDSPKQMCL